MLTLSGREYLPLPRQRLLEHPEDLRERHSTCWQPSQWIFRLRAYFFMLPAYHITLRQRRGTFPRQNTDMSLLSRPPTRYRALWQRRILFYRQIMIISPSVAIFDMLEASRAMTTTESPFFGCRRHVGVDDGVPYIYVAQSTFCGDDSQNSAIQI